MEKTIVVCIIENNERELLLQKKTWDYLDYPGVWAFFGGEAESEDFHKEINRELKEEIGISLKPKFMFKQKIAVGKRRALFYVFHTKLNNISKIKIGEGSGVAFFRKKELKNLNIHPEVEEILKKYFKEI